MDKEFKHCDPDCSHDLTLTLHDCEAEKISVGKDRIRFYLKEGFWIVPNHTKNTAGKAVRTDAAMVEFRVEDVDDIYIEVFTRGIFRKTRAEYPEFSEIIKAVNNGECTIEFIYQYRTFFEQMWRCALRSKKEPHYRECYIHLPKAEASFCWNNLRSECEW